MRVERRHGKLVGLIVVAALAAGCGQEPAEGIGPPAAGVTQVINREGVNVELSVTPVRSESPDVVAGDWADVVFRVTDAETGEPLKGRYPAAWMDIGEAWNAKGGRPLSCVDRVATYLQGLVGVRPMIDLNSHFLLVLNRDPSISVIDPAVGITGITNLFAQINLSRPGADWVLSEDSKQLFVSMPKAGKVALIDTDDFTVTHEIDAGENPMRVELQSDQRYLWVGNDAKEDGQSGVTVIDATDLQQVAFIPTGPGHHEIVFADNDRYAFITNRDGAGITVVDVQKLAVVKQFDTGPLPISIAYSPLSQSIYVADGKDGKITVIDPETLEIRRRIAAKPGLGPLRFTPDGRWGLVVNAAENKVFIVDASVNRLAHSVSVGDQPYQLNFTPNFAYVRSLNTQDVGLIPLSQLDELATPAVTYIPAGQRPPGTAAEISIADSIIPSVKQAAAAYIVNQAEGTVSYYMEGMGAPMGSFRNYGHETRAIEIVDRSLGEEQPGVYRGRVRIPVEGKYDVAFMMDTPRFLHCFTADVLPDPDIKDSDGSLAVAFERTDRRATAGESKTVRFQLSDAGTGDPVIGLPDVTVLYYSSDGRDRTVKTAKSIGGGVYETTIKPRDSATYYVFVGSESKKLSYNDQPFFSLLVLPAELQELAQNQ